MLLQYARTALLVRAASLHQTRRLTQPFRPPRQQLEPERPRPQRDEQREQREEGEEGGGEFEILKKFWQTLKWPFLCALGTSGSILLYHWAENNLSVWRDYRKSRLLFKAPPTNNLLSPVDDAAMVEQRMSNKLRMLVDDLAKDVEAEHIDQLDFFPSTTLDVFSAGRLVGFPVVYLLAEEWVQQKLAENEDEDEKRFWLAANIPEEAKKFALAKSVLGTSRRALTTISCAIIWVAFAISQLLRFMVFYNLPSFVVVAFNYVPISVMALLFGLKVLDEMREEFDRRDDLAACNFYAQGGVEYYTNLMRRVAVMATKMDGFTLTGDYKPGLLYNESRSLAKRLADCRKELEKLKQKSWLSK